MHHGENIVLFDGWFAVHALCYALGESNHYTQFPSYSFELIPRILFSSNLFFCDKFKHFGPDDV